MGIITALPGCVTIPAQVAASLHISGMSCPGLERTGASLSTAECNIGHHPVVMQLLGALFGQLTASLTGCMGETMFRSTAVRVVHCTWRAVWG